MAVDVKHLEVFPFGSEGVDVCIDCERAICQFLVERSAWALNLRKHEHAMRKQLREEKLRNE
jgi:hypothetical protein